MHLFPGRLILGVLLGLTGGVGALRAAKDQPITVIAVQVQGTVEVQHGQSGGTEAVAEGAQLGVDDIVTTAAQSSVMLVIPNGSIVALKEKSRLKIAMALQSPLVGEALAATGTEPREPGVSQTSFELAFGEMLTRVRKLNPSSTFEVQTPVSVAAVRGTVFEISYQPGTTGEAQYRLSTASGLVHVTPHARHAVAVAANEQVDLTAAVSKKGVKIKHVKSSKLDRRKQEKMQKEGMDNERNAAEFMQRAQQTSAEAKAKAAANPTREAAKDAVGDRAKNGTGQTGAGEGNTSQATKPTPPGTQPKLPARVPAVKRPPRRPGS